MAKRPERQTQQEANARHLDRTRSVRAKGRDIVVPEVVDDERRSACELDLVLFCTTYLACVFKKPFCEDHISILQELERKILYGGLKAFAAPRGWGKDSLLLAAIVWAICYGHCKYIVYAGPRKDFACDRLSNIKAIFERDAEILCEDFPEICIPARALQGSTQRGNTQTVDGILTDIHWGVDSIRMPMIEGSLSSGSIIEAAGINQGNRGFNIDSKRPDFFVVNDIEDARSVKSLKMQESYESVIDQSLGGIAGPGEMLSGFILCTVLQFGCLSQKYTDPTVKPAWNGERLKALVSPPENTDMWDVYIELRREGRASQIDPNARWAHAYYVVNREEMDFGAEVIWNENFIEYPGEDGTPIEVSALQHIYNEIADKGELYFLTELQNDPPMPTESASNALTPRLVASRLSSYPHGIVPEGVVKVVQGIDMGAREIHWGMAGFYEDGSWTSFDYGRIRIAEVAEGVDQTANKEALERELMRALRLHRAQMEAEPYKDSEGNERAVDLTLIDSGWFSDLVYRFCRESGKRFRPTKGDGSMIGEKISRFTLGKPSDTIKPGYHYTARFDPSHGWLWHVDTNFWKEWLHRRFLQAPGSVGCATFYGNEPREHRNVAKHICSERFVLEKNAFEKTSNMNHFLDVFVLCCVAASMLGIRLRTEQAEVDTSKQVANGTRESTPTTGTRVPAPTRQGGRSTRMKRIW